MHLRMHSASHERTVSVLFTCPHCRHRAMLEVTGKGKGEGYSSMGLGDEGAKSQSVDKAVKRAVRDGQIKASLVKCPECGKRDQAKVRRFALVQGLKILWPALLCLAVVVFFCHASWGNSPKNHPRIAYVNWVLMASVLGAPTFLLMAAGTYFYTTHWAWNVDALASFRPLKGKSKGKGKSKPA